MAWTMPRDPAARKGAPPTRPPARPGNVPAGTSPRLGVGPAGQGLEARPRRRVHSVRRSTCESVKVFPLVARRSAFMSARRTVQARVGIGKRVEVDEPVAARHEEKVALQRTEDTLHMVVEVPKQLLQRDFEWQVPHVRIPAPSSRFICSVSLGRGDGCRHDETMSSAVGKVSIAWVTAANFSRVGADDFHPVRRARIVARVRWPSAIQRASPCVGLTPPARSRSRSSESSRANPSVRTASRAAARRRRPGRRRPYR